MAGIPPLKRTCPDCKKDGKWSSAILPPTWVFRCSPCKLFQIQGDTVIIRGDHDIKKRLWARWNQIFEERQFKAMLESDIDDPRWEQLGW